MAVTLITNIKTPNWSYALAGFGEVVLDEDDILLCIHNILFTMKGSVPLDPLFGTLLYTYVDKPINKVVPLVFSEVTDAIKIYEQRVSLKSIGVFFNSDDYTVRFTLNMIVVASSQPLTYNLDLVTSGSARAFSDEFADPYA